MTRPRGMPGIPPKRKGQGMTIGDRILMADHIQANRYAKLQGDTLEIATEGLIRHFRACARMDIPPDASAIREIIDDALNGRRVFAEVNSDEPSLPLA